MVTKTVLFTSTENFTVPNDCDVHGPCVAECLGGGGAGGAGFGDNGVFGGGGEGGAYAKKTITGLTIGQTIPVTVGAGGTGNNNAAQGNPGQASSFGSYCVAAGGAEGGGGGTGAILNGGVGGSSDQTEASVGDVIVPGQHGTAQGPGGNAGNYGNVSWTDSITSLTAAPGPGGANNHGISSGSPGGNYGGGGGGGGLDSNASNVAFGGAGGAGIVSFTYRVRNPATRIYIMI